MNLRRVSTILLTALLVLSGCSESLDWREMSPSDWHLKVSMPCRPASRTRRLTVSGRAVDMAMQVCDAGGWTFSIAMLDARDPTLVGDIVTGLRGAVVGNIEGQVIRDDPAEVPGMTPHLSSRRLTLRGHLPDGRATQGQAVWFSRGTQVYQAVVLGGVADEGIADAFAGALKVVP